MKSTMLMFTTSAVIFACGIPAANAQDAPVGPTIQQQQGGQDQQWPRDQQQGEQDRQQTIGQGQPQQNPGQAREQDDEDRVNAQGPGGGMMGWYGRGMMGRDYGRGWMHGGWGRREGGGPGLMAGGIAPRIIFSLMDADGDGKLSLEEFRAAHDRIFRAMDADRDGTVTMQEMMDFIRGRVPPVSRP